MIKVKRLKTKHSVDLELKSNKSPFVIQTDKYTPELPSIFTFVGQRGSGKTHAAVSLLKDFERRGYVTRTFLISPTYKSTAIFKNLKTLADEDVCEDENCFQVALHEVKEEIEEDWKKYEEELKYHKVYKKHMKEKDLTVEEETLLQTEDYRKPQKVIRPRHICCFDDCQSSSIYSNAGQGNALHNLTIKHRHVPVTLFFLVQAWSGLPKTLRLNTVVFSLFPTSNRKELQWIYEHFATKIPFEVFEQVFDYATSEKHSFLMIDTNPKREKMRFRKSFNELIIVRNVDETVDENVEEK